MKNQSKIEKFCQLCLTTQDPERITDETSSVISSQLSISVGNETHICIRCKNFLLSFEKFKQNALMAQVILTQSEKFFTWEGQSDVTVFDPIVAWMNDVEDYLKRLKNKEVKVEEGIESSHEEELFCETIDTIDTVKEESEPKSIKKEVKTSYSDDETLEQYFQPMLQGHRRPYECPKCQKHYTKGELKYHMNVHNNLKPFKCVVYGCSSSFSSPRIMRVHAKRHHQLKLTAERPLYTRRRILDERYQETEVVDKSKINVICSVCGKVVRKKHFSTHFNTHSRTNSDLTCPYKDQGCPEVFRMRHLLTSHIQKKHDPSYIPELRPADRICELCGKCFTKATMKYHMNVHLGVTPYVCDFDKCTESFKDPTLLRQHKRSLHLKIKRFRCRYCPKKIYSQEEYDAHKKEDCGLKSIPCEICGKLINKMNVKCHIAIHRGERTFICPEEGCGKAFLLKNKLKQHSRSHSTELNYRCTLCTCAFKCKQSLTSHLTKKHATSQ